MRRAILAGVLCAGVVSLGAQNTAQDAARRDFDRIQALVNEGAMPRKALDEAQARLEEAKDEDILKATLYGHVNIEDLTEEGTRQMMAAANRMRERRKARLEEGRKLVDSGVQSLSALTPLVEEVDRARRTYDSAEVRARLFQELAEIVRAEQELAAKLSEAPQDVTQLGDRFEGDGVLESDEMRAIVAGFVREFGKGLPVSANGETALHVSLGFDHRGRLDVALNPDSREGRWLRRHLEHLGVPYFAFRRAVQGQSTGAHIHIGPPSARIGKSD